MFEEVYREYWQKVFRLCMGYVNDEALAKDLAQETFVAVYQKLPGFRHQASLGTWVFRIATNICLRQIERRKRQPQGALPEQVPDVPPTGADPRVKQLYRLIAALPETDRIIISLSLENVKQGEIAHIVGLSNANVRVRIHRIKATLRKKFQAYGR